MIPMAEKDLRSNNELNLDKTKTIKVAILAEEPLFWGSGKHFFPIILDGYTWTIGTKSYKFSTNYLFDKHIIKGDLNVSNYDVLLVPGGGIGDGQSIAKGFTRLRKVKRWKKNISKFIKDGGGYIGICGGVALMTGLDTGNNKKPMTFVERQYDKSSLGISCVTSYYKNLAIPLLYPFQRNHPERIGAASYVFSFAPGETVDGDRIHSGGVPIDFPVHKDNPIFSDFTGIKVRMRWWGGPALLVPEKPNRNLTVLARYPKEDLSENELTRIYAWRYTGGFRGLFSALLRAFQLIKKENENLKNLFMYTYLLSGDWQLTNKIVDLNFSNKPSMTAEIYPNENKGRILLCTAHPEYMVWWNGYIKEVDDSDFNCLATGFHQWTEIASLSKNVNDELTHTWWIVRRSVAWAAKVPDDHLPPIQQDIITPKKKILSENIFWDGNLTNQIKNI
jgi:hypothetical protein